MDYSAKVEELFKAQLADWPLARTNYGLLDRVRTRAIDFGRHNVLVQFNPERIRSSAAKVDSRSIEERPCFLCASNRPAEQTGVRFGDDMTILVNPFPIFNRHLTIVSDSHTEQRIAGHFGQMLEFARALKDFVIFYNGPQCGASAPDHFHYQAGNLGFLPIEKDFESGTAAELFTIWAGTGIWIWRDYGRGIATLRGKNEISLGEVFGSFLERFRLLQPDKPEPMLNILAYVSGDDYIVHLFPRRVHRPSQFFEEGSGMILLSPASVDLGGVVITPREEDFLKLTKDDLEDIFSQVCLRDDQIEKLFINFR
ncbi:MAG: DUF4922 domain-containing protein [Bacteroidales bacterium]